MIPMLRRAAIGAAVVWCAFCNMAMADDGATPTAPALTPTLESTAPTDPSAATNPTPGATVPHLMIVTSACEGCTIPETVPGLILQGYAAAAAKTGVAISPDAEATLAITGYTQRPPAQRVLFGAFAGKDEIKAVVTYKDKKYEIEDYFRNALQGMNALSERIGEMAFDSLK